MANTYRLDWHARVRNQIQQVPNRVGFDCLQAILNLGHDPYPPSAEDLIAPYRGIRKIKLDGWRILYEVSEEDQVVTIIAVKRSDRATYLNLFSVLF